MTCQCLHCSLLEMRVNEMAGQGLGLCKDRPHPSSRASFVSVNYQRECKAFIQASASVVTRREQFLQQATARTTA